MGASPVSWHVCSPPDVLWHVVIFPPVLRFLLQSITLGPLLVTSTNILELVILTTNLYSFSVCFGMVWGLARREECKGTSETIVLKTAFLRLISREIPVSCPPGGDFKGFMRLPPLHPVLYLPSPHPPTCSPLCKKVVRLRPSPPDGLCVWPRLGNATCLHWVCREPSQETSTLPRGHVPISCSRFAPDPSWSTFSKLWKANEQLEKGAGTLLYS